MTENTTTDHTAARTTWVEQCAERFVTRAGLNAETDARFAKASAEACADQQAEEHGPNPSEWEPPADAADEEMSYWEE
ncbi:hypothetical protein RCH27_08870 [Paracidovorax citrulli]|uniref:hypothetical protein n=1 Tax=Paracidovorax citrulli TaxID=80869 RepID=UPI003A80867F